MKQRLQRWAVKSALFGGLALFILNPNLKRGFLQLKYMPNPGALIQTNFDGLAAIQRELDRRAVSHPEKPEPKIVEAFVLEKIRYVSDFENWWNAEYWPTAGETWARRQEDCDGRAILAASLLRARGWASAHLAVGLNHVWVQYNANEKTPGQPPQTAAILSPDRRRKIEIGIQPGSGHVWRVVREFARPQAFWETVTAFLGDIPAIRRTLLLIALLLLCHHPCRRPGSLLAVVLVGAAAAAVLAHATAPAPSRTAIGVGLLLAGVMGALGAEHFQREAVANPLSRPVRECADEPSAPQCREDSGG